MFRIIKSEAPVEVCAIEPGWADEIELGEYKFRDELLPEKSNRFETADLGSSIINIMQIIDADFRKFHNLNLADITFHKIDFRVGDVFQAISLVDTLPAVIQANKYKKMSEERLGMVKKRSHAFGNRGILHLDEEVDIEKNHREKSSKGKLAYFLSNQEVTDAYAQRFVVEERPNAGIARELLMLVFVDHVMLRLQARPGRKVLMDEDVIYRADPYNFVHGVSKRNHFLETQRAFFRDEVTFFKSTLNGSSN